MINLLPPDLKRDYRYARRNYQLGKWGISLLLAIGGLAIITTGIMVAMSGTVASYNQSTAAIEAQLKQEDIAGTEKQVTDISNNLKLMVSILSKEILFSQMLTRLGNLTPQNVILTGLSIGQGASAIDISAQATDYAQATQLYTNLADPNNQIFSKADIIDISCAKGTNVANPAYPCTVQIRALFKPNNPFLFINANKNSGAK